METEKWPKATDSPKYQRIHFKEFHDKIIVANIFT